MSARSAIALCGFDADGVAADANICLGTATWMASCGISGASIRLIPSMHCSSVVMYVLGAL